MALILYFVNYCKVFSNDSKFIIITGKLDNNMPILIKSPNYYPAGRKYETAKKMFISALALISTHIFA